MISLGDPTELGETGIEEGRLDACLNAIRRKRRFPGDTDIILSYGHDHSEKDGHSIPKLNAVKEKLQRLGITFKPLEICNGNVEFEPWNDTVIDKPDEHDEHLGEKHYAISDIENSP